MFGLFTTNVEWFLQKVAKISHGAFFKQHLKATIVFLYTYDGAKRIKLHKGGNIKPRVMKEL